MARLNWVGIPGRPDPGVCLKTPWRSVWRATGPDDDYSRNTGAFTLFPD